MKPIHIFNPGTHVAMSGQELKFSEADLAASAAAYDPAIHEAPIVVGHPRHDLPAYGWVKSLSFGAADGLIAEPHQVDQAFEEHVVKPGRVKKISASFFHPESKLNPVPGVWYLRHVGFLGAQPPAIKGLRQIEFAEAEADDDVVTVEFSEAFAFRTIKNFFTRFREWLLVNHGQDAADQVAPSWLADEMDMAVRQEERPGPMGVPLPSFSEPAAAAAQPQGAEEMSDAEKARLAELEADNAALKAQADQVKKQQAEFSEREQKLAQAEAAARHAEVEAFVANQVKAGRVLPAESAGLAAFMESIAAADVVEFGEGDVKVSKPAGDWLRNFVSGLPARVDFSERARGTGDAAPASFAAPAGYAVHGVALDTHTRAKQLQAANPNLSFIDAVKAAEKEQA